MTKYEQKTIWVSGSADVVAVNELLDQGFSFVAAVLTTPAGNMVLLEKDVVDPREMPVGTDTLKPEFFRLTGEYDEELDGETAESKVKKTRKKRQKKEKAVETETAEVTASIPDTE